MALVLTLSELQKLILQFTDELMHLFVENALIRQILARLYFSYKSGYFDPPSHLRPNLPICMFFYDNSLVPRAVAEYWFEFCATKEQKDGLILKNVSASFSFPRQMMRQQLPQTRVWIITYKPDDCVIPCSEVLGPFKRPRMT